MGFYNTFHVNIGDQYAYNFQDLAKNTMMRYMSDNNVFLSMGEMYGNMFIKKLVVGSITAGFYQLVTDKSHNNPVVILPLFI